jgi:mRNA-degrading endonuclease toxin of MazEF toxin-antitoxin module
VAIEQGAIFWHDFGPRQNHLQEGVRPVLVVQSDALNRIDGYDNVIVVPLTTREKKAATYRRIEPQPSNGLERTSWAITSQIFTVAKSELKDQLGRLTKEDLYQVKEGLRIALGFN